MGQKNEMSTIYMKHGMERCRQALEPFGRNHWNDDPGIEITEQVVLDIEQVWRRRSASRVSMDIILHQKNLWSGEKISFSRSQAAISSKASLFAASHASPDG